MSRKIITTILILILGGILSVMLFKTTFELDSACSIDNVKEATNVSNNYLYRLQVRSCGATSDFVTEIVIVNMQTQASQTVLKIKGDKSSVCLSNWASETTLSIQCMTELDYVYTKLERFEDVEVLFSENIF